VRDLIRQMSNANPLWGAPRIHGELRKLGIEISQATVGKYMVRRPGTPSSSWRSFLAQRSNRHRRHWHVRRRVCDISTTVVTLILAHDRRKIVRFGVTQHPTAGWLSRQVTEAFPWDTAPRYLLRDRDASYGLGFRNRVDAWALLRSLPRLLTVANFLHWEGHRFDPAGVFGPHRRLQRAPSAPRQDGGSRFDEDRKQGPFADANDQSRASGEEEIGIPIAETIGGMQRNRRGFDVKPFEEFARTANG
jgi:hypothetical protein